jgi:hypothetical protein
MRRVGIRQFGDGRRIGTTDALITLNMRISAEPAPAAPSMGVRYDDRSLRRSECARL